MSKNVYDMNETLRLCPTFMSKNVYDMNETLKKSKIKSIIYCYLTGRTNQALPIDRKYLFIRINVMRW